MQPLRWLKPLVFVACLLPALRLLAGALQVGGFSLGVDPIAALLHGCGRWALNCLLLTLCLSPLREATGWAWPLRLRRMVGLFVLFYALAHLAVYVLLDQAGNAAILWQDLLKRPYITIGMLALVLLVPLALTSTARAMRRMGRSWTRLHRLVYLIAILGVWHFWWQVKRDIREPALYAAALALLLGYRLWTRRARQPRFSAPRPAATGACAAAGSPSSPSRCTGP